MRLPIIPFLLLAATLSFGQSFDPAHFQAANPRSIGPAGMSGRVTAIDVVLSEPDHIFAGAASGGVWESRNGGISWKPIFDDAPTQAVGAIAINQRNPLEIWVGTGEGNPRNSHNSGLGIFKSLDGGKTWQNMGLENTRTIHRILIHRDNPDIVWVAATGSAWGPTPDRGVYKTTDGGKTWRKVLFVNDQTGCADLIADPAHPNKLFAAMWEYGRKPWTFQSGGPGSGLYVSFDGGETWTRRTAKDGLPEGELGRIGLAVARNKPNIVYALVEAKVNALYRSSDGGFTWSKIADKNIGNRPFYYSEIHVDPKNENRIFNLFSIVTISEDGGKTFDPLLPFQAYSGVHPDHHAFWIHPEDPNYLIDGNDGGLAISRDGGKSWRFAENLPLGQFYHISYDMSLPYRLGGGLQDNGSWIGPSYIWQVGGIKNYEWQEIYFGDGFDVGFHPGNSNLGYAMSQGGDLARIDFETGKTISIQPVHPEGIPLRFNWNAGFAQDPIRPCTIYYGSQFVHRSDDCGESWTIISPDLTTNDTTKQKQQLSGGLTIDNTTAENHTTILAINPSPLDVEVIWVGTDDGNLQLTRDGGKTWTNLTKKLKDCPAGAWVPFIYPSPHQPGEAWVVVNNYRQNDWRPMVYHTTDYGQRFTRVVSEENVAGHALSIVQDPQQPNLLFLGTDQGLYLSIDKGATWTKWGKGFPSVPVADLLIHPREGDLLIGTFGRSLYVLDDLAPFRELARTQGKMLEKPLQCFDAPDAYQVSYQSVDAARFIADGQFVGENRSGGARFSYWLKPGTKLEEGKKVKAMILDESGDTLRQFSVKADTGLVRFSWNFQMDGVRFPSREKAKPDADPPGGMQVLPGAYRLVLAYGDHRDTAQVRVLPDPRDDYSRDAALARQGRIRDFYNLVERATAGLERVMEAKKTISMVNDQLGMAPDSTRKTLTDMGKSLLDSLNRIEALYLQPENEKGINRRPDVVNAKLFNALGYLADSEGLAPTQMAQLAVSEAEKSVEAAIERINRFFETDWLAYRQQVEAAAVPIFKDYGRL